MKKYIFFESIKTIRLTPNIINNCYEYINKDLVKDKLNNKDILPEVKLYYGVK